MSWQKEERWRRSCVADLTWPTGRLSSGFGNIEIRSNVDLVSAGKLCYFAQYKYFQDMDVIELRADLHNIIDKVSDGNILHAVKILLTGKTKKQPDWWDTISDEERAEIQLKFVTTAILEDLTGD